MLLASFLKRPPSLFPRHGCQCLVGLGTVLLDGHQIVGATLFDDAGGGVAGGVHGASRVSNALLMGTTSSRAPTAASSPFWS